MENPFLVSSVSFGSSVFSSSRAPTSRYVQDFAASSPVGFSRNWYQAVRC
jgi:hypothetical protein